MDSDHYIGNLSKLDEISLQQILKNTLTRFTEAVEACKPMEDLELLKDSYTEIKNEVLRREGNRSRIPFIVEYSFDLN